MKNRMLFMMLTVLGAPGIATASSYDLARSEYNFAVNELSKSSFNQAAIIGQVGTNNSANTRQMVRDLRRLFRKMVEVTGLKLTNQELITLLILRRQAMAMMPVYRKVITVILR